MYFAGTGYQAAFIGQIDITRHKNYKYLADADKKHEFDVERYMKYRPTIVKPDEPFDMYELGIETDNEID